MAGHQENMNMAREPSTASGEAELQVLHSDIKFGPGSTLASLKLLNFCYLSLHQPPETQTTEPLNSSVTMICSARPEE